MNKIINPVKNQKYMKPELISPAGDWISLRAAISSGADAVFFGIKEMNLRELAKNFRIEEIKKVISLCHKNKIKVYLTLNAIIFENEIPKLREILKKAKSSGIDAIIAWDFSVLKIANELNIPIHISTQASISNYDAIKFLKKTLKNLKCVVLARELSLEQIKNIIQKIKKDYLNVEIEVFVHGAMCISISGRCFMSHHIFKKSANRGECLQPCRRKYIISEKEDNYELELGEDYIMSPKDLCALPFIDKLIDSGISKFKIEGRNRSPEYVKTITKCYRTAIDLAEKKQFTKKEADRLTEKLRTVYNRDFSSGFYWGIPNGEDFADSYGSNATTRKVYAGIVKNFFKKISVAEIKLESEGIKTGDKIQIQGPTTGIIEQEIKSIQINNTLSSKAEKGNLVGIKTNGIVRKNDRVYLIEEIRKSSNED